MKFIFVAIFIQIELFLVTSMKSSNVYNNGTRFRAVKCSSDIDAVILYTCHLKAYSRRIVVLNLHGNIIRPFNKPIYSQFSLSYRYGTIYREVINTQKREWCSIMEGEPTHLLISLNIDHLKTSAPQMFHKCPYIGEQKFLNVTLDESKAYDVFPQGFYKSKIVFFNSSHFEVFSLVMDYEVKSNLKESFG